MTESQPPFTPASKRSRQRLGPYSRRFQRGVIADLFDGRSAEGRFVRRLEAELIAHVGGAPTITQRLLIDRLIKIRLQLDLLDAKLVRSKWTAHDSRTHGGLCNAFRLTAQALGLQPPAAREKSLDEILADIHGAMQPPAPKGTDE
jgi:hypothetical protein